MIVTASSIARGEARAAAMLSYAAVPAHVRDPVVAVNKALPSVNVLCERLLRLEST